MYRSISSLFFITLTIQIISSECLSKAQSVEMIDLTFSTSWKVLLEYYTALKNNWRLCMNCGIRGMGTAMHLAYSKQSVMYPALIPPEHLLTKLVIVDVSSLARLKPAMVLSLDIAKQWTAVKRDPPEPTLLLFKFGYKAGPEKKLTRCSCAVPGLSYELAEWIAANLSQVVGVATDAPTLESEETREMTSRTVSNLLGKNGIYMIENVNLKQKIQEQNCMTIAMPMKLEHISYVPTRLIAFCPKDGASSYVFLSLKSTAETVRILPNRTQDVGLEELLSDRKLH